MLEAVALLLGDAAPEDPPCLLGRKLDSVVHEHGRARVPHHDAVLILARLATDAGARTDLNQAITRLGFDRAELEAELDSDLAAGRE